MWTTVSKLFLLLALLLLCGTSTASHVIMPRFIDVTEWARAHRANKSKPLVNGEPPIGDMDEPLSLQIGPGANCSLLQDTGVVFHHINTTSFTLDGCVVALDMAKLAGGNGHDDLPFRLSDSSDAKARDGAARARFMAQWSYPSAVGLIFEDHVAASVVLRNVTVAVTTGGVTPLAVARRLPPPQCTGRYLFTTTAGLTIQESLRDVEGVSYCTGNDFSTYMLRRPLTGFATLKPDGSFSYMPPATITGPSTEANFTFTVACEGFVNCVGTAVFTIEKPLDGTQEQPSMSPAPRRNRTAEAGDEEAKTHAVPHPPPPRLTPAGVTDEKEGASQRRSHSRGRQADPLAEPGFQEPPLFLKVYAVLFNTLHIVPGGSFLVENCTITADTVTPGTVVAGVRINGPLFSSKMPPPPTAGATMSAPLSMPKLTFRNVLVNASQYFGNRATGVEWASKAYIKDAASDFGGREESPKASRETTLADVEAKAAFVPGLPHGGMHFEQCTILATVAAPQPLVPDAVCIGVHVSGSNAFSDFNQTSVAFVGGSVTAFAPLATMAAGILVGADIPTVPYMAEEAGQGGETGKERGEQRSDNTVASEHEAGELNRMRASRPLPPLRPDDPFLLFGMKNRSGHFWNRTTFLEQTRHHTDPSRRHKDGSWPAQHPSDGGFAAAYPKRSEAEGSTPSLGATEPTMETITLMQHGAVLYIDGVVITSTTRTPDILPGDVGGKFTYGIAVRVLRCTRCPALNPASVIDPYPYAASANTAENEDSRFETVEQPRPSSGTAQSKGRSSVEPGLYVLRTTVIVNGGIYAKGIRLMSFLKSGFFSQCALNYKGTPAPNMDRTYMRVYASKLLAGTEGLGADTSGLGSVFVQDALFIIGGAEARALFVLGHGPFIVVNRSIIVTSGGSVRVEGVLATYGFNWDRCSYECQCAPPTLSRPIAVANSKDSRLEHAGQANQTRSPHEEVVVEKKPPINSFSPVNPFWFVGSCVIDSLCRTGLSVGITLNAAANATYVVRNSTFVTEVLESNSGAISVVLGGSAVTNNVTDCLVTVQATAGAARALTFAGQRLTDVFVNNSKFVAGGGLFFTQAVLVYGFNLQMLYPAVKFLNSHATATMRRDKALPADDVCSRRRATLARCTTAAALRLILADCSSFSFGVRGSHANLSYRRRRNEGKPQTGDVSAPKRKSPINNTMVVEEMVSPDRVFAAAFGGVPVTPLNQYPTFGFGALYVNIRSIEIANCNIVGSLLSQPTNFTAAVVFVHVQLMASPFESSAGFDSDAASWKVQPQWSSPSSFDNSTGSPIPWLPATTFENGIVIRDSTLSATAMYTRTCAAFGVFMLQVATTAASWLSNNPSGPMIRGYDAGSSSQSEPAKNGRHDSANSGGVGGFSNMSIVAITNCNVLIRSVSAAGVGLWLGSGNSTIAVVYDTAVNVTAPGQYSNGVAIALPVEVWWNSAIVVVDTTLAFSGNGRVIYPGSSSPSVSVIPVGGVPATDVGLAAELPSGGIVANPRSLWAGAVNVTAINVTVTLQEHVSYDTDALPSAARRSIPLLASLGTDAERSSNTLKYGFPVVLPAATFLPNSSNAAVATDMHDDEAMLWLQGLSVVAPVAARAQLGHEGAIGVLSTSGFVSSPIGNRTASGAVFICYDDVHWGGNSSHAVYYPDLLVGHGPGLRRASQCPVEVPGQAPPATLAPGTPQPSPVPVSPSSSSSASDVAPAPSDSQQSGTSDAASRRGESSHHGGTSHGGHDRHNSGSSVSWADRHKWLLIGVTGGAFVLLSFGAIAAAVVAYRRQRAWESFDGWSTADDESLLNGARDVEEEL